VNAETKFGDKFKTNQDFNIVYTINIPIDRDLEVDNRYGNVTLGDLNAMGNFEIKYGNIYGKNLTAPNDEEIKLELKYGNATFDAIKMLYAEIGYSKIIISEIGKAKFDTKYSDLKIGKVAYALFDSKYDNIKINTTDKLKIESKYTGWQIKELHSLLFLDNEFGDVEIESISPHFEELKIVMGKFRFQFPKKLPTY
jgi:hypothetical protein